MYAQHAQKRRYGIRILIVVALTALAVGGLVAANATPSRHAASPIPSLPVVTDSRGNVAPPDYGVYVTSPQNQVNKQKVALTLPALSQQATLVYDNDNCNGAAKPFCIVGAIVTGVGAQGTAIAKVTYNPHASFTSTSSLWIRSPAGNAQANGISPPIGVRLLGFGSLPVTADMYVTQPIAADNTIEPITMSIGLIYSNVARPG